MSGGGQKKNTTKTPPKIHADFSSNKGVNYPSAATANSTASLQNYNSKTTLHWYTLPVLLHMLLESANRAERLRHPLLIFLVSIPLCDTQGTCPACLPHIMLLGWQTGFLSHEHFQVLKTFLYHDEPLEFAEEISRNNQDSSSYGIHLGSDPCSVWFWLKPLQTWLFLSGWVFFLLTLTKAILKTNMDT